MSINRGRRISINLDADEWYPVYSVIPATDSDYDEQDAIEVTEADLARWARAEGDFAKAQSEMRATAEAARKVRRR